MFWYEEEVKRLEKIKQPLDNEPITVFYGSSSIRLWDSAHEDFPEAHIVNFGFGGSTLAACAWYYERIMKGMNAKSFVLYAGDNDLGDGRHPEEVINANRLLIRLIREQYGPIPIGFISIKPSLQRWNIWDRIHYTNKVIKEDIEADGQSLYYIDIAAPMLENGYPKREYFQGDGLHISKAGYKVWKEAVEVYAAQLFLK